MEFPRKATKKNVDDFNTKNPNVKEIIDSIVHNKFMNDTLILDGEIPYEKVIKELVRNYDKVSENEVELSLNTISDNKNKLYRLNIYSKTEYYIQKLRNITNDIALQLNDADTPTEIKLSDYIQISGEVEKAILNFVNERFSSGNYNPYKDCTSEEDEHTLVIGKFFRRFIDENNLIWEENGIHYDRPKHIELKFHCYGFNNNSDVLFTNVDHTFSEESMKYDFEEGYEIPVSVSAPIKEENFLKQEKSPSGNVGCNIALMVVFAIFLFYIFIKVISG